VRRWFKIGQGDGFFFHPTGNEDAVFLSMPHVDDLVTILNWGSNVKMLTWWTDTDGNITQCKGAPTALCVGDTGTPHGYVPQEDDLAHSIVYIDDTNIISPNGTYLSGFLNGFLNRDKQLGPPILTETFEPPSKFGG
jgi:hypothetical protein